jgi:hypothetical protein
MGDPAGAILARSFQKEKKVSNMFIRGIDNS